MKHHWVYVFYKQTFQTFLILTFKRATLIFDLNVTMDTRNIINQKLKRNPDDLTLFFLSK
jgi:hypothetical protein